MAVSLTASLAPGGLALSRRRFILCGVSLTTAIGLTTGGARSTETQQRFSGDLFAFTAPDHPEVVFAVTGSRERSCREHTSTRSSRRSPETSADSA